MVNLCSICSSSQKCLKFLTRELGTIVRDQNVRHLESSEDMTFEKFDYGLFGDGCNRFCLHPFGIQIHRYIKNFLIPDIGGKALGY